MNSPNTPDHEEIMPDIRARLQADHAGTERARLLSEFERLQDQLRVELRLMNDTATYRALTAADKAVESAIQVLAASAPRPGATAPHARPLPFSLVRSTH